MVQVLMSTYNGEQYLREQIDSILQQEYPNIQLLIRDDGSKDGTIAIIHEYAEKYSNVSYYVGKNLGAKGSFFDLMKHADTASDYYAFSDQDDVWLPDKIGRAVKRLEKENSNLPLLYASKTTLVDESLKEIPMSMRQYSIVPSFGNALVENVCSGCTEVFNNKLLKLVNRRNPKCEIMHDWWLYLIASAFGKVVFDERSGILYRQHGNNSVGARGNWWTEMAARIRNFRKSNGALRRQAANFRNAFGNHYANSKLTDWVADYKSNWHYRMKLVTSDEVHRQGKVDDLIFRALFFFGLR